MKSSMTKRWTADALLDLGRGYQTAAIYAAAADLEVFDVFSGQAFTAPAIARKRQCTLRGMVVLLDALTALGLLKKRGEHYSLPSDLESFLTSSSPQSVVGMAQHQANCLRNWAQLSRVVKTGRPADRQPSVRGKKGDAAAFIEAMHNICAPRADEIIRAIRPLRFNHLLDVGSGSGTWTIAFLRACPSAQATVFDLPRVIPLARKRLAAVQLTHRVHFVAGDYHHDSPPAGADLAWVSAIVHQNSRTENRHLFKRIYRALKPGGRIAIRDVFMKPNRHEPVAGALFAVNMLVATSGGGTFTFAELREDIVAAGFATPRVLRRDSGMDSIVLACKPRSARPPGTRP